MTENREMEKLKVENLLLRQRTELGEQLREDRERQAKAFADHQAEVDKKIDRRLLASGGIGVLLVGITLYWGVIQPLRESVQERLDEEFSSDNIKNMISDAASRAAETEAKAIIESRVEPAVSNTQAFMREQRRGLSEFSKTLKRESEQDVETMRREFANDRRELLKSMSALRDEYRREVGELSVEVNYQREFRGIQNLKNRAINDGDFSAYGGLVGYQTGDKVLHATALAAMFEVKKFYLGLNRVSAVAVFFTKPDGTRQQNEEIATEHLVKALLHDEWRIRARASQLLRTRKEPGVPEALLKMMREDKNLYVRKEALTAFERITGFKAKDVFGFGGAARWWAENKDEYRSKVKESGK